MCGLTGFMHNSIGEYKKPDAKQAIEKMTSTLVRRGPDSKGIFLDSKIALGHRRLKIIDLSDHGSQPMQIRENGPVIAYNGETYNFQVLRAELISLGHRFKGTSDTEVIFMFMMNGASMG